MQNFLKLFINWIGAVRQQAIIWTNVDKDVCHHMVSPGINELTYNIHNPYDQPWHDIIISICMDK